MFGNDNPDMLVSRYPVVTRNDLCKHDRFERRRTCGHRCSSNPTITMDVTVHYNVRFSDVL